MKRGLVIGKFMPLHKGHIALIEFAASQCDELIVSMSFTPNDPIPAKLRWSWLEKIFQYNPKIKPGLVEDNFDDESLELEARTKKWSEFIRKKYPPVDIVFSSEPYGSPFAKYLGATHVLFDQQRAKIPVSASLIRSKPFTYWDFIPEIVRPYFVKKICFYGAESTGKSSMAIRMAEVYKTLFVPEVAREMLITNDFTLQEIIDIGIAHEKRIYELLPKANKFLFCDTDAITTEIYSQHYLGTTPEILFEIERRTTYDHYFLMNIDVPWIADGLRDLGEHRESMFNLFKQELEKRQIAYTLVSGSWEERERIVKNKIDGILSEL